MKKKKNVEEHGNGIDPKEPVIASGKLLFDHVAIRMEPTYGMNVIETARAGRVFQFSHIEDRAGSKFGRITGTLRWIVIKQGKIDFIQLEGDKDEKH